MRNPILQPKKPKSPRETLREAFAAAVARLKLTPAKGSPGRAGRRSK